MRPTRVIVLPAANPSLWTGPTGSNTYLLTGRTPTLIDAGVGQPAHLDALATGLKGQPLSLVLLTHSHSDHASGVPAVLDRWPAAVVRPNARSLVDAEVIDAGDGTLTAIYTPGHAPDHFCFMDRMAGDLYCGDLVRAGGTVVIPASRGGDLRAYLNSLQRIRELEPRRLLPGHGPIIDDPQRAIDEYCAHRAERESQILDALRRGLATPAEIVTGVYGPLPSVLVKAAADSVLAHLKKLEQDGIATLRDGRWMV